VNVIANDLPSSQLGTASRHRERGEGAGRKVHRSAPSYLDRVLLVGRY